MLHCCLSVVCRLSVCRLSSVTTWYRFETAQHSGLQIIPNGRAGSRLLWCRTASKKTKPFLSSWDTIRSASTDIGIFSVMSQEGSIGQQNNDTLYRQLFTGNPMALTPLSLAAVRNDQD